MYAIITIDTEADNQWQEDSKLEVKNLEHIPRFQELCEKYGMKPVYLCTTEVVASDAFENYFMKYEAAGTAEIGTHLHPWSTPPFADNFNSNKTYPSELPLELFEKKMKVLTDDIAGKIDRNPVSYRAGRWGFKCEHVSVLKKLGYKIDCSVTPYLSWESSIGQRSGGPDFRELSPAPFYLSEKSLLEKESDGLLEVPATVLLKNNCLVKNDFIRKAFIQNRTNIICRIAAKVLNIGPHWLRPYPAADSRQLTYICEEAKRQKLPCVELMFHSSELLPGGSFFNSDSSAIEQLYKKLEDLFCYFKENSIAGLTLREFYDEYRKTSVS